MPEPETATTYGDYQPSANQTDVANHPVSDAETAPETHSENPSSEVTLNVDTASEATVSGGAPALNLSRAGDMLTSDPELGQRRLALGSLPPSLARVERSAYQFRRALEDAYTLAYGDVDFQAAAIIQTASRWERHAGLALRWLRDHEQELDHAERLGYSREIARASSERDKAIASLKLGAARKTLAATLYPALKVTEVQ